MSETAKLQTTEPANPFAAAPEGKKKLTLIGIYACVIGSYIQSSTLSTLLPVAAAEIGGMDYYSLAKTLTGVISVAAMPLFGYLGAKNPAIRCPLLAASVFVGALVIFARAFASNMTILVIPCAPFGVLSAGVLVLGYTMMRDMYDRNQAGTYLGLCGTMVAAGMLLGPIIGGFIMDNFSWRMFCHIIWPILLLGGILILCGVKVTKEEVAHMAVARGKFDFAGAIAEMVFLGSLILGLSLGTSFAPFGSPASYALFALAAASLIALVIDIKKKQGAAIIPTTAMKDRNIINFTLANFCSMFSNMAVFFFLPTYCITVMHASASEAGLAISLYSVIGLFMGPVFGRAVGKAGTARGVLSVGCVMRILIAGVFFFILAPDANIFLVYVVMFLAGIYSSVHSAAFSVGPQVQLDSDVRMQGNSLIQVGHNLGSALGTAVYSAILASMGVASGMPVALGISVAFAALALVCAQRLKKLDKAE